MGHVAPPRLLRDRGEVPRAGVSRRNRSYRLGIPADDGQRKCGPITEGNGQVHCWWEYCSVFHRYCFGLIWVFFAQTIDYSSNREPAERV